MYSLIDIKNVHLEVTNKCQASCPMCARNAQGGIANPWFELHNEITLSQFIEWFPVDFIKNLDRLYMCGNLGDPVVAKDTLEIFKYLRQQNPTMSLSMNTNGSARDEAWWQALAQTNVQVIFGIDGLADTHHLYRVGTDWNKIIANATVFIAAGGNAEWHMLGFQHNEHQVDAARDMSISLGFANFQFKNTSRFRESQLRVLTKEGKTSHILYPSTKSKIITTAIKAVDPTEKVSIHCKAQKDNSVYINSLGQVIPCCWLDDNAMVAIHPSKIDMRDNDVEFKSLSNTKIEDAIGFEKIASMWNSTPLKECSRQCGKIDKFSAQFG